MEGQNKSLKLEVSKISKGQMINISDFMSHIWSQSHNSSLPSFSHKCLKYGKSIF